MTQESNDNRTLEDQALKLAETTDVSPKQARELIEKHGFEKAEKEARKFKAEG
jgi:hypothetical protein